jgi:hypothetical protein
MYLCYIIILSALNNKSILETTKNKREIRKTIGKIGILPPKQR